MLAEASIGHVGHETQVRIASKPRLDAVAESVRTLASIIVWKVSSLKRCLRQADDLPICFLPVAGFVLSIAIIRQGIDHFSGGKQTNELKD